MNVHWELTTVIKCVITPLAPTIAAVISSPVQFTALYRVTVLY